MRLISYNSPSSLNFRVFYINWFDDFFKIFKIFKRKSYRLLVGIMFLSKRRILKKCDFYLEFDDDSVI